MKRKWEHRAFRAAVIVPLLVAAAAGCRLAGRTAEGVAEMAFALLRAGIYLGLFTAWGLSLRRRIIQKQVQPYLAAIPALMIFWLLLRTCKFCFASAPAHGRWLWYGYYVALLFIPLLFFLVALCMGKPEEYRLPRPLKLLFLPAAALLLLVLTNDLHQLVFVFPGDTAVWTDSDYRYGAGYCLAAAWGMLCAVSALLLILRRCRLPHSRKILWQPLLPLLFILAYTVLYVLRAPLLDLVAGDMTVVYCLAFAAILEGCIQCGLIQSNTHYEALFRKLTLPAVILDPGLQTRYATSAAGGLPDLTAEAVAQAGSGGRELPGGKLLKSVPVKGGCVLWMEDISQLSAAREELRRTARELSREKDLLEAEIALKEQKTRTDIRNRLYATAARDIAGQFDALDRMAAAWGGDPAKGREALKGMCVIGAYIKRRCNLLILSQEQGQVPVGVLTQALGESALYLRQYGADCAVGVTGEGMLPTAQVMLAYDLFEAVVEACLPGLSALMVRGGVWQEGFRLKLSAECPPAAFMIPRLSGKINAQGGVWESTYEDGVLYVRVFFPKGGEM